MPNLNTPHNRPITLALLAMGGEGGGVLADWAIDMASTMVSLRRQLQSQELHNELEQLFIT